jgi:hypothetical protein
MQKLYDKINEKYKMRFYNRQKRRFRDFIIKEFEALGYENITVDKAENVIIGDAENAETVYSAHYDTPMFSPYITPYTRLFGTVGGSYAAAFMLLLVFALCGFFISRMFRFGLPFNVAFGLVLPVFFIVFSVFPNPNNANDNTSGILAVYNIAGRLKGKDGCCFILFNNEEKGLKGSSSFEARYKKAHKSPPAFNLINLDCVGVGENVLLAYKSEAGKSLCEEFKERFEKDKKVIMKKASLLTVASDNLRFENGILITMISPAVFGAFYIPRIHMPYDDEISLETISGVCDIILNQTTDEAQEEDEMEEEREYGL